MLPQHTAQLPFLRFTSSFLASCSAGCAQVNCSQDTEGERSLWKLRTQWRGVGGGGGGAKARKHSNCLACGVPKASWALALALYLGQCRQGDQAALCTPSSPAAARWWQCA